MEVTVGTRSFTLSETLQSDALAPIFDDAWTASRVWRASRFLSEALVEFAADDNEHEGQQVFHAHTGPFVVELGSGCGLAGLVAVTLGADVVLTDQHEAIELLERNVASNLRAPSERERVRVLEYKWGEAGELPRGHYDYILISDCINPIYGLESWRNLARSIKLLSHAATTTFLAHESRGDDEALVDFLAFSAGHGLDCERIRAEPSTRLSLFKISLSASG